MNATRKLSLRATEKQSKPLRLRRELSRTIASGYRPRNDNDTRCSRHETADSLSCIVYQVSGHARVSTVFYRFEVI